MKSMVEQDPEELKRVEDIRRWCEVFECKDSESDIFITAEEVEFQVFKMAKGKASGPHGLTAEVLQALPPEGFQALADSCSLLLKTPQEWPESWWKVTCILNSQERRMAFDSTLAADPALECCVEMLLSGFVVQTPTLDRATVCFFDWVPPTPPGERAHQAGSPRH